MLRARLHVGITDEQLGEVIRVMGVVTYEVDGVWIVLDTRSRADVGQLSPEAWQVLEWIERFQISYRYDGDITNGISDGMHCHETAVGIVRTYLGRRYFWAYGPEWLHVSELLSSMVTYRRALEQEPYA